MDKGERTPPGMAKDASKFLNRELSWLEFNQRVLDEAADPEVPLLDRLFFLSVTASNLDEFFMVRVGGLELLREGGVRKRDAAGMTPTQQLRAVATRVRRMIDDQYACYRDQLADALRAAHVVPLGAAALTPHQYRHAESVFRNEVFPVVTPVGVDPDAPFPVLSGNDLHIAVRLRDAGRAAAEQRFAVIPLKPAMRRFVSVPCRTGYACLLLEDLIGLFMDRLFPGATVLEQAAFRVTRNAETDIEEEFTADFLAVMEQVLRARRQSGCVRLEVQAPVSRTMLSFLSRNLGATAGNTFTVDGPTKLGDFGALASLEGFDTLRSEPWQPSASPDVDLTNSIFEEIRQRDILLYHPYESFDPVLRLLDEAARDPDVLAVKQTLYRTSARSPVIAALAKAAERGKYVTALVELKARFDEARNIEWARELERAGVQVIYGVKGLKTHSKICVVVRREPQGMARYMHFGTGNYNEKTARMYADISYMTRDPDLGLDASSFFNAVCGYSEPPEFLRIAAAPIGLRERLLELIEGETERCRQGQTARIMAKMNSLVDPALIDALYRASRAGVRVDLNVRGICCLRPGRRGLSENITVTSIIDRYLEHARIYCFHQGGRPRVFISSADWMPRNLDRRVELMVPVDDPACRKRLLGILDTHFRDTVKARRLLPDGGYERVQPRRRRDTLRSQAALHDAAVERLNAARKKDRVTFEPHRPA